MTVAVVLDFIVTLLLQVPGELVEESGGHSGSDPIEDRADHGRQQHEDGDRVARQPPSALAKHSRSAIG